MAELSAPQLALNAHRMGYSMGTLLRNKSKTVDVEESHDDELNAPRLRSSSIFKTRRLNAQARLSAESSTSMPTPHRSLQSRRDDPQHRFEDEEEEEEEEVEDFNSTRRTATPTSPQSSHPHTNSSDGIEWEANSFSTAEDPTKAFPQRKYASTTKKDRLLLTTSSSSAPSRASQSQHLTTLVDLLRYEREKRERFAEVESADELREYLAQLRRVSQPSQSLPSARPRRSATVLHRGPEQRSSTTFSTSSTERQSSLV